MRRLRMICRSFRAAALQTGSQGRAWWLWQRSGQGLVEYGLVLVLIMVVCVAILTMVGQTVSDVWYVKLLPTFK